MYPGYDMSHHLLYFPFGLAYVAAVMIDAGHDVTVVDMEGELKKSSPREPIPDLDTLPWPAWNLFPIVRERGVIWRWLQAGDVLSTVFTATGFSAGKSDEGHRNPLWRNLRNW